MSDIPGGKPTEQPGRRNYRRLAKHAALWLLPLVLFLALLILWPPNQRPSWTDVILAVATIAYVVVTFLQLRALKETVGAQREATEGQRLREHRELRAYVGFEDGDLDFSDTTLPPVVAVKIVNSGQTPALNVRHRLRSEFAVKTDDPLLPPVEANRSDPEYVLFPRSVVSGFAACRALSGVEIGWVRDGDWTIYVYGEVEYGDIFGQRHMTCCRLMTHRLVTGHNRLFFCSGGNSAT